MAKKNMTRNKRLPRPLMRKPSSIQFPKQARDYEPQIREPSIYGKTRELVKKQGYFFRSTNTIMFEKIKSRGKYYSYQDEDNSALTTYVTPSLEDAVADGIETSTLYGMKPLMLAIDARPYIHDASPVMDINRKESREIRISKEISFAHIVVINSLDKLKEIMSLAGLPFNPKGKALKDFEKYYLSQPSNF